MQILFLQLFYKKIIIVLVMDLCWLRVPQWEKHGALLHGFLGRRGGKSAGPYASLNLSFRVGDDSQVVKDNICDVKRAVGVHDARIVTMKQMHGDQILEVKDRNIKEAGEADGMVTEEKGLFLGVLTADCVPILFTVFEKKLAAVVHAGWRGTLAGIAPKMVDYLKERYDVNPASMEVALGPAIGLCCYEIGPDVADLFEPDLVELREGKQFLNLKKANVRHRRQRMCGADIRECAAQIAVNVRREISECAAGL